jgi:hypothetical protein
MNDGAKILRDRKLSFAEAEAFNADLAMTRGGIARSISTSHGSMRPWRKKPTPRR